MAASVRIGNGQGFWGDSVDAPLRLLRGGPIDYITMDYLAEVTMSIMQRQKVRNPERGYATDFVRFVDEVLPEISERGTRIVANAGGVNTEACRDRVVDSAERQGVTGMKIDLGRCDLMLALIRSASCSDLDTLVLYSSTFSKSQSR